VKNIQGGPIHIGFVKSTRRVLEKRFLSQSVFQTGEGSPTNNKPESPRPIGFVKRQNQTRE
jgi:hypothetical protein